MRNQRTHGSSLLELTLVLVVMALAGAVSLDAARAATDRLAVNAARRTALAVIRETAARARAAGGAHLLIDTVGARFELRAAQDTVIVAQWPLGEELGVRLSLGSRAQRVVRYDPAGIGRVANHTLTFTRGRAIARVRVSLFGRAR